MPVEGCALLTNPINPGVKEPALWDFAGGADEERGGARCGFRRPMWVLDGAMRDGLRAAAEQAPEMVLLTNSRAGGNNIVGLGGRGVPPGDGAFRLPLAYYELQAPRRHAHQGHAGGRGHQRIWFVQL